MTVKTDGDRRWGGDPLGVDGNILALNSSGDRLRVELRFSGGYRYREQIGRDLNETLILEVDTLLRDAGVGMDALWAVAVNQGPGNYSRLRVLLTWAKTVTYFLKIPLLGFDSFEIANHHLNSIHSRLTTSPPGVPGWSDKNFLDHYPLRVYRYEVSANHTFICPYWSGRRLGPVIPLERLAGKLGEWGMARLDREGLHAWLSRERESGIFRLQFSAEAWGDIISAIKSQEKIFFPTDIMAASSANLPGKPGNILEEELIFDIPDSWKGEAETHGRLGLLDLAEKTLSRLSSQELSTSPLAVNPIYFREFGE